MSLDYFNVHKLKTEEFWNAEWSSVLNHYEYHSYLSSVSACLFLSAKDDENKDQAEMFSKIFNQMLDFGDWLISKGIKRPLVLVIHENNSGLLTKWQKLAGEQENLRGQFSIQPVTTKEEASLRLKQVLDEAIPEIVEIQPKSDALLAKEIENRLLDPEGKYKDEQQRKLLQKIASEIINPGVVQRLNEWDKNLEQDYQHLLEGK